MRRFSVVVLASLGAAAMPSAPAVASVWDEARKVCLDRYNDELKSGSVPNRMTKDRYVKQCQASYVRSAKLEDELEGALGPNVETTSGDSFNGQGGPEDPEPVIVDRPKPAAAAAPARDAKPLPRPKPRN